MDAWLPYFVNALSRFYQCAHLDCLGTGAEDEHYFLHIFWCCYLFHVNINLFSTRNRTSCLWKALPVIETNGNKIFPKALCKHGNILCTWLDECIKLSSEIFYFEKKVRIGWYMSWIRGTTIRMTHSGWFQGSFRSLFSLWYFELIKKDALKGIWLPEKAAIYMKANHNLQILYLFCYFGE